MKVGDLVKVQYETDGEWYTGFVTAVATDDPSSFYKMYCTERSAFHILNPERDNIEMINES